MSVLGVSLPGVSFSECLAWSVRASVSSTSNRRLQQNDAREQLGFDSGVMCACSGVAISYSTLTESNRLSIDDRKLWEVPRILSLYVVDTFSPNMTFTNARRVSC